MTSRPLEGREKLDWLRLSRTESIGAVTFSHLILRYGSATDALREVSGLAQRGGRSTPVELFTEAAAEQELAAGERLGARMIASCEPEYPRMLSVLDYPPPLIWALGDRGLLDRRALAIVGARAASAAGQRFAHSLALSLGEAGYAVVSGMARGIDTAAHKGSLQSGTIAVLAGGVDNIYPPENAGLYDALRNYGLILSERPVGHTARAADFPRRNRVISGLSLGVVVIEAEIRSGSLITARLAGEQGRDVFAVPGSPLDPRARGANDLIRQGATLVEDVEDILRVIEGTAIDPTVKDQVKNPVRLGEEADIDAVRTILIDLLSTTPVSINDLARAARAPVPEVLAALTELSIAGRAEMLAGGLIVGIPVRSR